MNKSPLIEDEKAVEAKKRKAGLIIAAVAFVLGLAVVVAIAFVSPDKKEDLNDEELRFLFVNDVHVDPLYVETGIYDEENYQYCREPNKTNYTYKWGRYGCDSPWSTFLSMSDYLQQAEANPSYIVYGGDTLGHSLNPTIENICGNITLVLGNLTKNYDMNTTKLLFTLGNNDFSPNYGDWDTEQSGFEKIAEVLKPYQTDEQQETFRKGGYYAEDIPSQNIRLLMLNTVIYSATHRGDYNQSRSDPYDQFAWMNEQCENASKQGMRIGLIMHIPPAIHHTDLQEGFHEEYSLAFFNTIKDYEISFILVSHTHKDQIIPLWEATPLFHTLSAPSLTPSHSNNPGFRVYTLKNGTITNYQQYYADIRPNPKELTWEFEYDYNTLYSQNQVDEASIQDTISKITTTGKYLWAYRQMIFANADPDNTFYICALNAVTQADFDKCYAGVNSHREFIPYAHRKEL